MLSLNVGCFISGSSDTDPGVLIQRREPLGRDNRQDVFVFELTLPQDLLPSTYEGDSNILKVSYTLQLTSKRGIFGSRKMDSSRQIFVKPHVNLWKDRFYKVINITVSYNLVVTVQLTEVKGIQHS